MKARMFDDGRKIPRGSILHADLCIIGAGAAGITIARALAGTSLSVILLESGGLEEDTATQSLYKGKMTGVPFPGLDGDLGLDIVRLRYFGGTTNHWAGWCRPLEPIDFRPTPARPDDGWPFGRETLDPWYEQAVNVVQIGPFEDRYPYWSTRGATPPLLDTDVVTTRDDPDRLPAALRRGVPRRAPPRRQRPDRAPRERHRDDHRRLGHDGPGSRCRHALEERVEGAGPRLRRRYRWHRGAAAAARVQQAATGRHRQRERPRGPVLHGAPRRARGVRGAREPAATRCRSTPASCSRCPRDGSRDAITA